MGTKTVSERLRYNLGPDTLNQAAADIEAAADHLETHGWTQLKYFTEQGECCAMGALMLVTGESHAQMSHFNSRTLTAATAFHIAYGAGLITLNDTLATEQAQVIAVMREVAPVIRAAAPSVGK